MRLTSIDLYSNNQRVATLSYKDPGSVNPYIAQSVTGLDANEIVPKFYGKGTNSNKKFHMLSLLKREIVLLIALNPQPQLGKSYSELRDDLYRAISSSRDGLLELRFKRGKTTIAVASGFVIKFENVIFSKTPQVQMTIECEDSMLHSLDQQTVDVSRLGTVNNVPDLESTAPHGFDFSITFTQISTDFVIKDKEVDPDWSFTVTPGLIGADTGFLVGDELYFSNSIRGKQLYIVRGVSTIYLFDKVEPESIWPVIFPGNNEFVVVTDGTFTWDSFSYYLTYWGV